MPNHFSWRKVLKKKELNLQIVKISGRKTETTDNKFHDFFSRIGKKKEDKNEYNRLSQGFLENSINAIKIKIENDTLKDMIEKYKKTQQNLHLKVCFFQI